MILGLVIAIFAVIIFLAFIIGGWILGTYNLFIKGQQNIKTQWSNILAEYQRRADLFYNLAQAVKSYAKFEHDTMTHVIKARGGNFGKTKDDQIKNMSKLDDAFANMFSRLLVVFERYPKLQAIEQYNSFSKEVRITEDRVNIARTDYNGVVKEYNLSVKTFPNMILANIWRFQEEKFFLTERPLGTMNDKEIKMDLNLNLEDK
jgi:LemA protein